MDPSRADVRRKSFVRLVTYTMAGLVAFTLLGVTSFILRQRSMEHALAATVPTAPPVVASLAPALAPAAPLTAAPAVDPPNPAAAAPVATRALRKAGTSKPLKKSPRSPSLSAVKSTSAKR